ncbi:GDP-mannose 4,6-dehydratase [Candidatus Woesearchaeota archaeon]|nr:GDP-mannose 4,6-dehydratase [Candidatus Woesearchaeota archaeon]
MSKKILVTGAAGFIGSHTVDALLARGDSVIGIDNFNDYYDPMQKERNIAQHAGNPFFKINRVDICDQESVRRIVHEEKPDRIIHLAARAGVRSSVENPLLYQHVNVCGTTVLLEAAREFGVKKFVFASSSSVYGSNKKMPFSENDAVDHPISPYAATKRAGELTCSTYHHLFGIDIACLRFFTVYGPRGRPDMAPYLFTKSIAEGKEFAVFGDGSARRDFTYIDDIVAGVIAASDKNRGYEIFNLGNSQMVEVNHLIRVIEQNLTKRANVSYANPTPGDVPVTCADISKARRILGYDPQTSIEEGMRRFVAWYNEQKQK